jgi:transcriptional regulator with XRE-family HTH domain
MLIHRPEDLETESFAGLLLRHRGRTGLTQRDLAARLGTTRRAVQDWESGAYCPSAERLQAPNPRVLQVDRHYERLDITGLSGITEAQRQALIALGAVDRSDEPSAPG